MLVTAETYMEAMMNPTHNGPDRDMALAQYRRRAKVYDWELAAFEPIRRQAIARLCLVQGATVMDVGCGTGLSFEPLQQAIGSRGHIIGIEQCPEMLDQARARVAQQHWRNVTLLNTPVEASKIKTRADAVLFHFTHDVLRNPEAIHHVVRGLKPGAHVVAAGLQWANPWAWHTNWSVWLAAIHSVTSLEGLDQPWSLLVKHLSELQVSTTLMGGVYIASGIFVNAAQPSGVPTKSVD
jgi:ubiquinone/menaquinone biosynthesis C-methylase UbiE